jgi:hypothetical protein
VRLGAKDVAVSRLQAHSRQKIRTDHLQAVASRLVALEHQSGRFKRLLDDRQSALVRLEIKDLPRLSSLPGQVLRDFPVSSSHSLNFES